MVAMERTKEGSFFLGKRAAAGLVAAVSGTQGLALPKMRDPRERRAALAKAVLAWSRPK
jgi:hypothetical protein